jgi:3-phosphoshikimate 1-carboxyvinyltransferase
MVARTKECDRISSITNELRKMGAHIEERPDGLKIYPSPLKGACLSSYEDQRMALSLSVAALGASSPSVIQNSRCIEKTYKNFISDFRALGADICDR